VKDYLQFYINGAWVDPVSPRSHNVIHPGSEDVFARISLGSPEDVEKAVNAAHAAFESYSRASVQERVELLENILAIYKRRYNEVAHAISMEIGAPDWLAKGPQANMGVLHFGEIINVLKNYAFEKPHGKHVVVREPIGVCALIAPWNWPINQVAVKVAPALAAGCTMVLKPSKEAPISAMILAEIIHEAGAPKGVFNLINGDGTMVGDLLAKHPKVDMVSFTGSTRAGVMVAKNAADTVKRVSLELGGKSANIVLEDANFGKAVAAGVKVCFVNSGQSCNAPTRMLVPHNMHDEAVEAAKTAAAKLKVGDPFAEEVFMGPVVSKKQFDSIQGYIQKGIEEGAQLVFGGPGMPEGLNKGYYVRPTIFANVDNKMTIAQEEIFGPVLSIIPYKDEEDAIRIANDTIYGLSGYVQSSNIERAKRVALRMRTGNVHINGVTADPSMPFGGYKQSGLGREWGEFGMDEFLEIKGVFGVNA
jgi:aldehyde dehydrogenase (NAD+)